MSTIVIKTGSNVLTRNDGTLNITRLSSIVDQVSQLVKNGHKVVLVSSGAVASGRGELRNLLEANKLDALSQRQLFSAVGQAKLINHYYDFFREHGLHCGQVLATKENFARRGHYLNQRHCIMAMLEQGIIPVVNENDTVSVTELMFTDNDELAGLIAAMVGADRLFLLSNIDGLYTAHPSEKASELISEIKPGDDLDRYISDRRSSNGRGGMKSKCRIALRTAAEGIETVIANGTIPDIIPALAEHRPGTPCTVFKPGQATSGVKKWIAHSDAFATGAVTVNNGAYAALRSGASLLPVGVIEINADFDADDIIKILDQDGNTIAWGKAEINAENTRKAIGLAGAGILVHADYLYVDP